MTAAARRIGILAGGGTLPREFADAASASGAFVQIVALGESADLDFGPHPTVRVSMGQIGRILSTFQSARVDGVVIIGPVRRADISRIRPDFGFFRNLPAILKIITAGGDDGALSGVVKFFEAKGFRVLGPHDVAPETLAPIGPIAGPKVSDTDLADARLGFEVIRALGPFDIGQAAIVRSGRVEAIEAAEGTNVMLERRAGAGSGLDNRARRSGVLVKCPKPGQELRVDTPSIGPGTVARAVAAGLAGIAVAADGVLMAERAILSSNASAAGLFVAGLESGALAIGLATDKRPRSTTSFGTRALSRSEVSDASKALAIMDKLAPYACGGFVVVARGHVMAVEAGGETLGSILDRVADYRTRHGSRSLKRSGVVAVKDPRGLQESDLDLCKRAGLKGVVVADRGWRPDAALMYGAERTGLIIATRQADGDQP